MAGNTIAMYIDESVAKRLFDIKKKHGKEHNITSASKLASALILNAVDDESKALEAWEKENNG